MIELDESLLPDVVKLYPTNEWPEVPSLNRLEEIMDDAIRTRKKMVLYYVSPRSDETGMFPPIPILLQIVAKLMSLRQKIKDSFSCNVIYVQDPADQYYLDLVLKFYTPANPVRVVYSKAEAATAINEHCE